MSEWIDRQTFGYSDRHDASGNTLTPIITATNADGSIAPPIIATIDYVLRDQKGEPITDQTGASITLEGMTYA